MTAVLWGDYIASYISTVYCFNADSRPVTGAR